MSVNNPVEKSLYCCDGSSPDDIVITGISGRFPDSDNVQEFSDGIYNKKNFFIPTESRWEAGAKGLPFTEAANLKDIARFDSEFFGIPFVAAELMEPEQRILLEVCYEAICDSGYDPQELRQRNIGVYCASSNVDSRDIILRTEDYVRSSHFNVTECMRANRCSYCFDFKGPSYCIDSACSSSAVALNIAMNDLKEGRCEAAVVCASELNLNPEVSYAYHLTGILSSYGICCPFDENASGIARSEAIVAVFLQKASVARRIYGKILSAKVSSAGYVPDGISVPSEIAEVNLFKDVLKETKINSDDIQYVEAHGTGTAVGDPIEISALSKVYCKDRKKPLLIGTVKSNIGHPEPSSGLCGIVKAVLAFETGLIAPNINYNKPSPLCHSLIDGRIKVITDVIPLTSDYMFINCFGFGGTIGQIVLKKNTYESSGKTENGNIPQLVLYSASSEEGAKCILDYVSTKALKREFFALLHNLAFSTAASKPYRGFAVLSQESKSEIQHYHLGKREVWYVLTGMGCQWPGMGCDLMNIEVFAQSIRKSARVLEPFGINILEFMKPDTNHLLQDRKITPAFVTTCAIQIALIDVLKDLGIVPDGIIGHSTGEVACAYADGCCTAEQTILSAYWRGHAVEAANLPHGAMAAVGMTWQEAKTLCPKDVYAACHNAQDSVTISGLAKPVENFVAQLKKENRFARVVNAYDYAFHCPAISAAAPSLKRALDEIIKCPNSRTKRWLSTSYPPEQWHLPEANIADSSYFTHNLLSTVHFAEALSYVPHDAITIEIGPHCLLQSLLKRVIGSNAAYLGLMERHANNINFLLLTIGKLYTLGLNPKIDILYPAVNYPVPRGTPMISNLIKWNHERKWPVPVWSKFNQGSVKTVFDTAGLDQYLLDHCIEGRPLFPAMGYIYLAWDALARQLNKPFDELPVVIEDFKIHRATLLSPTDKKHFSISILNVGGQFEIVEGITIVATGKITTSTDCNLSEFVPNYRKVDPLDIISGQEMYSELCINGYEYGPAFQTLIEANIDGSQGLLKWTDKWIPYLDAHLLFFGLLHKSHEFYLPTGILYLKIDPFQVKKFAIQNQCKGLGGVPVKFEKYTKCCSSPGIEMRKLRIEAASHSTVVGNTPVLEAIHFVPYQETCVLSDHDKQHIEEYIDLSGKLAKEIALLCKPQHTGYELAKSGMANIQSKLDDYLQRSSESYVLLSTLNELSNVLTSENFMKDVKNIFEKYIINVDKDILYQTLWQEYPLRQILDTVTENSFGVLKVVEVAKGSVSMLPLVSDYLKCFSDAKLKLTLVHPEPEILDHDALSQRHIEVHLLKYNLSLNKIKGQDLIISSFLFGDIHAFQEHIRLLSSMVQEKGFILLLHREQIAPAEALLCSLCGEVLHTQSEEDASKIFNEENLTIVSKKSDSFGSTLYLLRYKNCKTSYSNSVVHITDENFDQWVDKLRNALTLASKQDDGRVWVIAQDSPYNGVVGMVQCLKKEPDGEKLRCIFIVKNENFTYPEAFDFQDPFYAGVIEGDLVMNIHKNGTWGSFKSKSLTSGLDDKIVEHSYLNCRKYGDLSSFEWLESPVKYNIGFEKDEYFVHIYYSALNFRDVMFATGKMNFGLSREDLSNDRCVLGIEYSGILPNGQRVMGVASSRGMATAMLGKPIFTVDVPDHWSLEEAATVPVVYFTCYYALLIRGGLSYGESILIHSAAGGIGIAAIRIALSLNCMIFVTVGTKDKVAYLKKTFPQIEDQNIGYSRDVSFEDLVLKQTNGRGVDVILNSLADEKLQASIRCLAENGRFIEIGKYDLLMDHKIGLEVFLRNTTFHGVCLIKMFKDAEYSAEMRNRITDLLIHGIQNGVVQPIDRTVFDKYEAEKAFRYMASGKHIGKVILKIRNEPERGTIPTPLKLKVKPCTYFYKNKTYIIIGGLGGFGIELTKWLLQNGAHNIVLTSRYGVRTSYHRLCMHRWRDIGANVIVSVLNVANLSEAKELLEMSEKIAPVGGIFNSAVILKDAFMESQSADSFVEVYSPKAAATKNLDTLSRNMCPFLDLFVCFSSISCGRGNAGQSNYGYANSVMERICEKRRSDGLHGLAIQWGIIGDVGVVHRHMGEDAVISGVVSQKVKSCLEVLSQFLHHKQPVLSSYIKADISKKKANQDDFLPHLAKIFGYKDPSEMRTLRTFAEIGMDSMIGVEIQQVLENKYDMTLSIKELQQMKVDDVLSLIEGISEKKPIPVIEAAETSASIKFVIPQNIIPKDQIKPLKTSMPGAPVFIIHYSEAELQKLSLLVSKVNRNIFGLLCTKDVPTNNLRIMALSYLSEIQKLHKTEPVHFLGYSHATSLTLEMASYCQKENFPKVKSLTLLDGTLELANNVNMPEDTVTENKTKVLDLLDFIRQFSQAELGKVKEDLEARPSFESQLAYIVNLLFASSHGKLDKSEIADAVHQYTQIRQTMRKFSLKEKIISDVTVIEATGKLLANDVSTVKSALTKLCNGKIVINRIQGGENFLSEEESASKVAELLNKLPL